MSKSRNELSQMTQAELKDWYWKDLAFQEAKFGEKLGARRFPVEPTPLAYYTEQIETGQPFTFQRYGDGDWNCIQRRHGFGDIDALRPGLRTSIVNSLTHAYRDERYMMSIYVQNFAIDGLDWLEEHVPNMRWHDEAVFGYASRDGQLYPFVKAIRELDVPIVIVGPPMLRAFNAFNVARFVEVSPVQTSAADTYSWNDWQRVVRECLEVSGPAFFTFSMGLATKAVIWELFGKIGQQSWLLDVGSLWDVYVGDRSRKYHFVIDEAVIKANLGDTQ